MITAKVFNEVYELLGDSLKKRGIELYTSIPSDLPVIQADETEVFQVITNLLRNAMQSIEVTKQDSGTIKAMASVTDNYLEIRITDNGIGITPEIQKSIFDFHFTTKEKSQGTGLGLGISRRFIRDFGGDLVLEESAAGCGATFLITLPLLG